MSNLSETYKGWRESGMSGRGNTDAIIHAIVEELLKPQPMLESRSSFTKTEESPKEEKPKKK